MKDGMKVENGRHGHSLSDASKGEHLTESSIRGFIIRSYHVSGHTYSFCFL